MVDYTKLAATAQRLVQKNGRTVTLVRRSTTPANSSEPWKGPADEAATITTPGTTTGKVGITVKAVFAKSDAELAELFGLAGEELRRGAKFAFVAGADMTPEDLATFDTVIDGADVWQIESSDTLRPGDIALLHALELTR